MKAVQLPRIALVLGLAGVLPQVLALFATYNEADRFTGLAAGYFYATLIFSFLGGLWWGIAVSHEDAPDGLYVAAIVPSLIAFASGIPWMTGATWPGPSLGLLGLALLIAPVVDWRLAGLGLVSPSLLRLRVVLTLVLGGLTLALATR